MSETDMGHYTGDVRLSDRERERVIVDRCINDLTQLQTMMDMSEAEQQRQADDSLAAELLKHANEDVAEYGQHKPLMKRAADRIEELGADGRIACSFEGHWPELEREKQRAEWEKLYRRAERKRDAALARVKELEVQLAQRKDS